MLLAMAERRLGLANNLARVFPDRRDPTRVVHSLVDMFRARMFAICCGYEDADDLDHLRSDPAFKLACGRLPDTGRDLCSQPTLSRLENAPRLRDVIRLTYTLVDAWMDSYPREPASVTLDIDDTCDVVHGHQQLSLFNAHYDERCFLPIHVYDTEKSRPVAVVLRPGKTPGGVEVRAHLRRTAYPDAVAQHANYVPWRRALCPAGGHGVVRDQRHRLHLRSVRHQASRQKSRRGRRRHPHPTRHREPAGSAWLRSRTAHRRPY
ncbi:hypothetical protein ACVIQT_010312 [Bradyrhizobium diazoefficiens]